MEGRDSIAGMLATTLANTRAHTWPIAQTASETDGIVEAWFIFEAAVARGKGHCARSRTRAHWAIPGNPIA
jgi:putative flavoprotein involved in K+ transport